MTDEYTGACPCQAEQFILEVYDEDITEEDLDSGSILAVCKCKCAKCKNVYLTKLRLDTPLGDDEDEDKWDTDNS